VRHPQRRGVIVCGRCGDVLCTSCDELACDAADCDRSPGLESGALWAVLVPWEARAQLGWRRALGFTLRRIVLEPRRFFEHMSPAASASHALSWAALCGAIGWGAALAIAVGAVATEGWELLVLVALALPLICMYRAVFVAGLWWGALRLVGDDTPYRVLLRVAGYGYAADLFVPFGGVGLLVGVIWHAIGLRLQVRLSPLAAGALAFVPLVLTQLLVIGLVAVYFAVSGRPL